MREWVRGGFRAGDGEDASSVASMFAAQIASVRVMRVRELLRRLAERGVNTAGATDRADLGLLLVRSLQAERDAALASLASAAGASTSRAEGAPTRPDAGNVARGAGHVPAEIRLMRVGELKRRLQAMGVPLVPL